MADDGSTPSVGDAGDAGDLDRIAAGVVTTLTLLVGFGLLAFGVPWFWVAFPVGFGGVLPVAVGLARRHERARETNRSPGGTSDRREAALSTLRDRYARGEIDEAEFEHRVERLLRTENVADAGDYLDEVRRERESAAAPASERATDRVPDAAPERERELDREWNRDRRE